MNARSWLGLLVLVCTIPFLLASNTHDRRSESEERSAWFGDMASPYVVSGCVPAMPSASLTTAAFPCTGYVRATTGELVYVSQASAAVGPLTGGDGTFWLAVHRNTSTGFGGWTRQAGTHYLWQRSATQPPALAEAIQVAKITVASDVIAGVQAIGPVSPRGQAVVYTSQFASAAVPIQAAINALPPHGGTVYIEPGTHLISSTINVGNGDVGVASLKEGVTLECIGQPGRSRTESSTVLKYTGTAGFPVIAVKGPLVGWSIKNCYIDGNSLASVGVYVQSARGGDVSNLVIEAHTFAGIHSTCVPTGGFWSGATDSLRNKWYGLWIWHLPPAQAGSAAIVLNSNSISCNTDFNDFFGVSVLVSGVDGWGVYVGASDHNMFYNLHIFDSVAAPATRSGVHFAYDNGIYSGWPCSNNFYGVSLGETGMSASGVPLANNQCSNSIFGLSGGDPADYVPDLPGVVAVYGNKVSQDLLLIAGRGSANTKPVGDVMVYTHADNRRHLVPSVSSISDVGTVALPWRQLHLARRGVTTDTTLTTDDNYLQVGNVSATTNIILPSAVTACDHEYTVKNITTNPVVLNPVLSQSFENQPTFTMRSFHTAIRFKSDCLNWRILELTAPFEQAVRVVTGDTNLDLQTDSTILVFAGGPVTIGLGHAVTGCAKRYAIKNLSANDVTIVPLQGGQFIEGGASVVLADVGDSVLVQSDCTNWLIMGNHGL